MNERDFIFFANRIDLVDACWLWTGWINHDGYGRMRIGDSYGPHRYVHRLTYEHFVGPIPEGLELDHVRKRGCVHRHCVNPAHLEPVTHVENVRRGGNRAKTRCSHGHPFSDDNTYVSPRGYRHCKECRRRIDRKRRPKAAA